MNLVVLLTALISSFSFLFFFPSLIYAKIELVSPPARIEINKEFELTVSLSNLSARTHFLSIALHKKSGYPYFGQTKNGDNWVEADDNNCKTFLQARVDESTWSGKLSGKFFYGEKDFDNSLGNYILKIFKYTDSCNKSSSDDIAVELFDPNPPPSVTPTSFPTKIPSVTIVPTKMPLIQTKISVKAVSTPIEVNTIVNSVTSMNVNLTVAPTYPASPTGSLLGITRDLTQSKSKVLVKGDKKTTNITFILIGLGLILIAIAIVHSFLIAAKNR